MKRNINKASRVLSLVLVFLLVGQTVFATTPAAQESIQMKNEKLKSKTVAVGSVQKGREEFKIGNTKLPSYTCMNVSYVLLADLKKVGANVAWDGATGKTIIYDLSLPVSKDLTFPLLKEGSIGYLGRDAVYINYQEVPAIYVEEKALIPAKWIPSLLEGDKSFPVKKVEIPQVDDFNALDEDKSDDWMTDWMMESEIQATEGVEVETSVGEGTDVQIDAQEAEIEEVEADVEEKIEDAIEEIPQVDDLKDLEEIVVEEKGIKGINIWFNGKDYLEEPYDFSQLEAGGFGYYKDQRYDGKSEYSYVGFVITELDGVSNVNAGHHKAWLKNPTYFTIPKGPSKEILSALFPDTRVKGIMKYAAGGFAKGETVNVLQASSNAAYYLSGQNGKSVKVPWNSVAIQKSPVTKEEATKEQIEKYINSQDFSSKTKYFVWTDIYRQRTYVFEGSRNKWKLIRSMLSSTGKDTHLTPVGKYTLNVRVPSFGGNKYRAKNAYGFIGTTYLYHSVLYDPTGKYLLSGWGHLGNKASSGCIRLSPEDSTWLYKTMPIGTGIFIN